MREAVWSELARGCTDRGVVGGFSIALLRAVRGGSTIPDSSHPWAMAALTSYRLKSPPEREEVCLRLAAMLPESNPPRRPLARLDATVSTLPGIGERNAARLRSLGLRTLGDLVDHLPRDYLDRRTMRRIADLRVGEEATVEATVREASSQRTRSGRRFAQATVSDGSGYIVCLWWGQPWRAQALKKGSRVAVSGTVEVRRGKLQMSNPACDPVSEEADSIHTGRIVPVYPASEQVSAEWLRRVIHAALERLDRVPDPLPADVRARRGLLSKDLATRLVHFPTEPEMVAEARRRLVFEELFVLQVGLALRKRHVTEEVRGIVHERRGELIERFVASLPFRPTAAQARAMDEIAGDMAAPKPMHRLLQGDVGSGKTLVAVHAALVAAQSGTQAAIMAPTEVLAEQHARRIRTFCEPIGVDVGLLTGSVAASVRRDTLMRLGAGDLKLVCGTHALISEDVSFDRLGIAVVDEQHRFGLAQRMVLRAKGAEPDVLIMTATPIPRTLALTLYGDLDVSVLDELPAGRLPIETRIARTEPQRQDAYELVRSEVTAGRRAFVVCALVDPSDTLAAKAATEEAERLRSEVFPDLEVGLLHGQMRPQEKDAVMNAFRAGEVSVLISTTVIEVGVDVPEATVMLIEDAHRFGISQLHQLRGRIGRGEHGGVCVLFAPDDATDDARRRLEAVAATTDGFELAEVDLEIRGEGTIFGTRQAGMTDLKVARLIEDFPVVVEARDVAFALVDDDPHLDRPEHRGLREEVNRRFGESLAWLSRG